MFVFLFVLDYVLRPELENDAEDKNLEVDLDATLEEDFGSTTKIWKETGEVSKEGEVNHELKKASQKELANHNPKLVDSQEDIET